MKYKASVITVSDRAFSGEYTDRSGPAVKELLEASGYIVDSMIIIPDEKNIIKDTLISESDRGSHLILTTGGTGFSPRDITPEATRMVIEREAPGIAEYMRMKSAKQTPRAILSRGISGIRGSSIIINLPGSPKGAAENLSFVLSPLAHALEILNGATE